MKTTSFLAFLVLLASTACSGYLEDRLKDAAEMCELSAGISVGLEGNVRATKLLQVGFGSYTGDWFGVTEGRFACWSENRVELGLSPFYFHELFRTGDPLLSISHPFPCDGGYGEYLNDFFLITDRGFFEFGLTANLIAVGVNASFEGAEFVDWLTGWFGHDLLSDDAYSRTLEELLAGMQSPNSRVRAASARAMRLRTGQAHGYIVATPKEEFTEKQIDACRRWERWLAGTVFVGEKR